MAGETANGVPEQVARFTLSMFQATRSGHFSHADPTLSRLLARTPRSIADQLSDTRAERLGTSASTSFTDPTAETR